MLKNMLRIFHGYFQRLEIFNTKFITKIQFCMKKSYNVLFEHRAYHTISYIAKFEVKIPLVHEEIKKEILVGIDWTN